MKKQKPASNPNAELEKSLGIPKYDKPKPTEGKPMRSACKKK